MSPLSHASAAALAAIAAAAAAAAAGDDTRIEHYATAMDQGRVAAMNMLEMNKPFTSIPFFWTMVFGKGLRYVDFGLTLLACVSSLRRHMQLCCCLELMCLGGSPVFLHVHISVSLTVSMYLSLFRLYIFLLGTLAMGRGMMMSSSRETSPRCSLLPTIRKARRQAPWKPSPLSYLLHAEKERISNGSVACLLSPFVVFDLCVPSCLFLPFAATPFFLCLLSLLQVIAAATMGRDPVCVAIGEALQRNIMPTATELRAGLQNSQDILKRLEVHSSPCGCCLCCCCCGCWRRLGNKDVLSFLSSCRKLR